MNIEKEKVLDLIDQTLHAAVSGYNGMKVNKTGDSYDSVDIHIGTSVLNVRIGGDNPLAIFKDIAKAIPY